MIPKQLQLLIKLQEGDLRIQKIEYYRERIPIELCKLKENCLVLERELVEIKEAIDGLEKERRNKEREIEGKNEYIAKRKKKLMEVKTNKEYSAVLSEIDSLNKVISDVEEEVIAIMEKIEEKKNYSHEKAEQLKKEIEAFSGLEEEKKAELSKLEEKLGQLRTQRESLAKSVEENLLKNYYRISRGRKGVAIVPVIENICQGCHMTVTPQTVSEIKMNNRIITCLNCSRIL